MSGISLYDMRRVAESLAALQGKTIAAVVLRSDLRQLRVETTDGMLAVLEVVQEGGGRARLDLDVIRPALPATPQLEVRFDGV